LKHSARLVKDIGPIPLVLGNEIRSSQVFVNLLVNAAQAITGKPQDNEIRVVARAQDDRVVVDVCDTGSGVPVEVADRIFEPFVTTKPPITGTGLGLSICQGILESMGGRISLERGTPGTTCFRVVLAQATTPTVTATSPATNGSDPGDH
jgi:two-component system, cell cycle sensor histidine kinase and response regulator CckA